MKRNPYHSLACGLLLIGTMATAAAQPAGQPVIELLALYPNAADDTQQTAYLYLDTQDREVESLTLQVYDNALTLQEQTQTDLLPYRKQTENARTEIVGFPVARAERQVLRFIYRLEGDTADRTSPYYEQTTAFEYLSDLPYTKSGTVNVDKAVNGSAINIAGQTYRKGFGIHAEGWTQTALVPGRYQRFVADVSKQYRQPYVMAFALKMDNETITTTEPINSNVKISWDYPIADNISSLRINTLYGGDGSGNDHGSVGGARLYLTPAAKQEQRIDWTSEQVLHRNRPFQLPLQAIASSGLEVIYTITQGNEYATIEQGGVLNVHTVPEQADIRIEAHQPGDPAWQPAAATVCTFHLRRGVVVNKDQRVELDNGEQLEELIVYADAFGSGQVVVKEGVANVKKLMLKYTFIPGTWNFISFPADLNIDKARDLNDKGYYLNAAAGATGSYQLRSYSTQKRAETPTEPAWTRETTPIVQGLKGYIMRLDSPQGTEPVEITFTIDNVAIDFETTIHPLHLSLDLWNVEPDTRQTVYIKPANVKGNTLKVNVDFRPDDPSVLPVNHAKALEQMRITFTPNRKGLRLTLPDQTPAKVAFYDRKGRKLIKAVRYISPMMIDMSDMKPGTYQMAVSYGPATTVRTLEY